MILGLIGRNSGLALGVKGLKVSGPLRLATRAFC